MMSGAGKIRILLLIAAVSIFAVPVAQAFVPIPPHLVQLVVGKIKRPTGLEADQVTRVFTGAHEEKEAYEVKEHIIYSFPGKLRCETVSSFSPENRMVAVVSGGRFVKIVDGALESARRSVRDYYTDILLFRDRELFEERFEKTGVDFSSSSIQRYNDRICFVAGKPPQENAPSSSFWVDKESLFPVRYTVKDQGRFVDIRYKNWQKVSRTWYPMRIETYLDKELFSVIDVESFSLETGFDPSLFDIDRMMQQAEKPVKE